MHVLWWWEVDGKKWANQVKIRIWRSSQFWAKAQWSWTVSYPPTQKKTKDDMGSVFLAPYCRIVCIKLIHVPPIYHHGSLEFFKTGKYLSTCHVLPIPYCWWKTSCTTWHVWNPVKQWDKLPINWCRIVSINSIIEWRMSSWTSWFLTCRWLLFCSEFFGVNSSNLGYTSVRRDVYGT